MLLCARDEPPGLCSAEISRDVLRDPVFDSQAKAAGSSQPTRPRPSDLAHTWLMFVLVPPLDPQHTQTHRHRHLHSWGCWRPCHDPTHCLAEASVVPWSSARSPGMEHRQGGEVVVCWAICWALRSRGSRSPALCQGFLEGGGWKRASDQLDRDSGQGAPMAGESGVTIGAQRDAYSPWSPPPHSTVLQPLVPNP